MFLDDERDTANDRIFCRCEPQLKVQRLHQDDPCITSGDPNRWQGLATSSPQSTGTGHHASWKIATLKRRPNSREARQRQRVVRERPAEWERRESWVRWMSCRSKLVRCTSPERRRRPWAAVWVDAAVVRFAAVT